MRHARLIALLLATAAAPLAAQNAPAPNPAPSPAITAVAIPAALTAEEMPPIPLEMAERARPYLEARGAGFAGWDPNTRAVLIATRFANTNQLHRIEAPMGAREVMGHLRDLLGSSSLAGNPIVTRDHCYACTAGQGSSCGGVLNE